MAALRAFRLGLGASTCHDSFPVAEHGGTIQSSSGLYIIVEGVSH
jgi:hypothetical protein